jgi:hypothetical protein
VFGDGAGSGSGSGSDFIKRLCLDYKVAISIKLKKNNLYFTISMLIYKDLV